MIVTLEEALASGRGIERSFSCPVHEASHPTASVNTIKGVWYCLSPSSRVLTADLRWVPISDVRTSDELLGFDEFPEEDLRLRWWRTATVTGTQRLRRQCVRITLDDGTVVVASTDHQWLTYTDGVSTPKWRRSDDLIDQLGKYVSIMRVTETWEKGGDYDTLGEMRALRKQKIVSVVPIGEQEVVAVQTSTGTFVAEGLASHNCYSCNASGTLEDHVPKIEEALKILAGKDRTRVYPEAWLDLFDADHASPYWTERYGIEVATANRCGTSPLGYPTYPVRDPHGRVWGVVTRHEDDPKSKYHYPFAISVSRTLYGSLTHVPVLVLVEGASDVMALQQAALPAQVGAVGCFGAAMHSPQVALVATVAPKLILAGYDADESGEQAGRLAWGRCKDIAPVVSVPWSRFGKGKDPGALTVAQRRDAVLATVAKVNSTLLP